MTDGLVAAHDLVVAMDYGQFLLRGGPAMHYPDDLALLAEAQAIGDGVAADRRTVLVLSPHQNNFAMATRIEVWDRTPPDDLDSWDEAFEAGLEVDPRGELRFESPTMSAVACAVPPGRYRILVAARGFVAHGWPGSTTPGDSWRVQLWPADGEVAPRRLRSWDNSERRPAAQGAGPVDTRDSRQWTAYLRTELLAHPPGDACCRRAEAATLLRLTRDAPSGNQFLADAGQLEQRLRLLLGDQAKAPSLTVELGLVTTAGQPVRGLPPRLVTAERCCVMAVWHGALSVAGELIPQANRLQALVWCPNPQTALGLVGTGQRIGVREMMIRQATVGPDHEVLIKDGPALLTVVAAAATAEAWRSRSDCPPGLL